MKNLTKYHKISKFNKDFDLIKLMVKFMGTLYSNVLLQKGNIMKKLIIYLFIDCNLCNVL